MSQRQEKQANSLFPQEKVERLARFSVENDFTKALRAAAPEVIAKIFQQYNIDPPDQLTRTLFFLRSQRAAITRVLGEKVRNNMGEFLVELGVNIIFLGDDEDEVTATCTFFHEMMHSLGIIVYRQNGETEFSKVGYRTVKRIPVEEGVMEIERGFFMEESVVDLLAVEMSGAFLRGRGLELSDEQITRISGGQAYEFLQMALLSLVAEHHDLFVLLMRARFNPRYMNDLVAEARRVYGSGTINRWFSLDFAPLDIAMEVMRLAKPKVFR